jgi:hypothetical protein
LKLRSAHAGLLQPRLSLTVPIILIVGIEMQLTLPSQYLGLKHMTFGITSRKILITLFVMWEQI